MLFRLASSNLNGIRSAANKAFEMWAEGVAADCMGVQGIKAQADAVAHARPLTERSESQSLATTQALYVHTLARMWPWGHPIHGADASAMR